MSRATKGVVWIVDDGPEGALMAQQSLGSAFTTRIFTNGVTVMEQLDSQPLPDVLLLDWVMPDVSGVDVCKFLRSRPKTRELAILLLTAYHETQQIVEGLAAGANDYLKIPYVPAELVARVGSLIRFARLREQADKAQRSVRALLAHLPDALITTTAGGEILFLNEEAEKILSTLTVTVKGQHIGSLFPALAKLHESVIGASDFEAIHELELASRIYAPSVRKFTLDGVPTIAVTLRDVTEKRRLALRRLDFYSMVAHDLRSPLAAMALRIGRMKEEPHGPLPERFRKNLDGVDRRLAELVALINDFLEMARSEEVGLKLVLLPVDLVALVRTNLAVFEDIALANEVKLHFEEPKGLVVAQADAARLIQVLTNLVSNAVKFSSKGGEVVVRLVRRELDVELSVCDAGQGIAEEKVSELFKRYSRADAGSTAMGTGLGLMIVREIIVAHGGTCGVESTLGQGSRFWVRLPHAKKS